MAADQASRKRVLVAACGPLAAFAILALTGLAGGEVDGPVLGGDGVWHAGPHWEIEAGETLEYEGITMQAPGNLTLGPGASLRLANVTLTFDSAQSGRNLSIGRGATLVLGNSTVLSTATNFTVVARFGSFRCDASTLRQETSMPGHRAIQILDGNMTAARCLFETSAGFGLHGERSNIEAVGSRFASTSGALAPLELESTGDVVLDSTEAATIFCRGSPRLTLYAAVTFRLTDAAGAAVVGRVNGSLAGPSFFYSNTDANGTVGPLRLLWRLYDPAPGSIDLMSVTSSPVLVTGIADGVGGNSTTFVIDRPNLEVVLRLNVPFDVGLEVIHIVGGNPTSSGPRAFYVALGDTHTVSVRVRNGEGQPSEAAMVRVRQYEVDPASWALHATSRELPALALGALEPGGEQTLSFEQAFGEWGTLVEREEPCYHSTQYFSVLELQIDVNSTRDFGPWNNTARVGVVAFHVEGDENATCLAGSEASAWLVAGGGAAAITGAVAVGYYFSEGRTAKRAARRASKADREAPPPP